MKSHSLNELKEGPCIKETKKMRLPYMNSTMEDALKQLKKGIAIRNFMEGECAKKTQGWGFP